MRAAMFFVICTSHRSWIRIKKSCRRCTLFFCCPIVTFIFSPLVTKEPCKITRRSMSLYPTSSASCVHGESRLQLAKIPTNPIYCWSPSLPDSSCKPKPLRLTEFTYYSSFFCGEITLFIGITAFHMLFKHTDFSVLNRFTKILSFTMHVRSTGASVINEIKQNKQ